MACLLALVPVCEIAAACWCAAWTFRRCSLHGSQVSPAAAPLCRARPARWTCAPLLTPGPACRGALLGAAPQSSKGWPEATAQEFRDVPRICRIILAVYENDVAHPKYADRLNPDNVVKRVDYKETGGRCPSYMIYIDHEACDVALAIRGLHLGQKSDYGLLLNNKKGQQMFDGGYAHHGLLDAAGYLLEQEFDTILSLLHKHPGYTLTLAGHSLGSGIAALMAVVLVNNKKRLGKFSRKNIRVYGVAPARSMSLNLCVRYADTIRSIVLQDDFLPRTSTPLQVIFGAAFCLPCLLVYSCLQDTFISDKKLLRDPRRLYSPGRLYHVVNRRRLVCHPVDPIVRTAIPVDGRFEHIVCSGHACAHHSLTLMEEVAGRAVELMEEKEQVEMTKPPDLQRMDRQKSVKKTQDDEHDGALDRAASMKVAGNLDRQAQSPTRDESFSESGRSEVLTELDEADSEERGKISWDDLIAKLLTEAPHKEKKQGSWFGHKSKQGKDVEMGDTAGEARPVNPNKAAHKVAQKWREKSSVKKPVEIDQDSAEEGAATAHGDMNSEPAASTPLASADVCDAAEERSKSQGAAVAQEGSTSEAATYINPPGESGSETGPAWPQTGHQTRSDTAPSVPQTSSGARISTLPEIEMVDEVIQGSQGTNTTSPASVAQPQDEEAQGAEAGTQTENLDTRPTSKPPP
eukprot:SM000019S05010  [mRNA]  locus=s19:448466:452014:- [translate_table: standard]